MAARFSIVVPVYNVGSYLSKCLDSILLQTYEDWEAICVDDGSTDGSGSVLDEYAARDGRFKVIHQKNGGEGAARNTALDSAQGTYVAFLDADDLLLPWALENACSALEAHPGAAFVKFDYVEFKSEKELPSQGQLGRSRVHDIAEEISAPDFAGTIWCRFYRRSAIDGLRFTKYVVGADGLYLSEVLIRNRKYVESDTVVYGYRQRASSIMQSGKTLKKQMDGFNFNYDLITTFVRSGKTIDRRICRRIVNASTEDYVYSIYQMPKEDRNRAWKFWHEGLPRLRSVDCQIAWSKFVMLVCCVFPWCWVAILFCFVPHWLKVKGLHR